MNYQNTSWSYCLDTTAGGHILESGYFENPTQADHWHRTIDDPGRPYAFVSVEQLRVDFFGEVERTLRDLDVQYVIVEEKLR